MRRCDRHPSRENDPYLEFSFEKSLRKYESYPQKKIKSDTCTFSKHVSIQSQASEKVRIRENVRQQTQLLKELPQESNIQKLVAEEQFKKSHAQESQNQDHLKEAKQIEMKQLNENQSYKIEDTILFNQQSIQIEKQEFEVDSRQKEQRQSSKHQIFNQSQKVGFSERQLIKILQFANPNESQSFQILIPFQKEQTQKCNKNELETIKKYTQKQGRLNLTENISVSLRAINRYKQRGITKKDIIEKLLNRMKFTNEERVEVSNKLDEFLEINQ